MKRPILIAGNWKMNLGPGETRAFLRAFRPPPLPEGVELLVFPPALSLAAALEEREAIRAREGSEGAFPPLHLGVQNLHWETHGAFTGELAPEMARDAGASHTLVGHSERRQLFGESDEETARKVAAAYRAGLTPILCLGETLEERRRGRLKEVLHRQLEAVLAPPSLRDEVRTGPFVLAYEPVWAIGTGETATPADAAEAHGLLRRHLGERLGDRAAGTVPILYGGSVKPENAAELLAVPDVDGVLVGGASLDPDSFARIAGATSPGGG
jgi:triosephosphate isomerase (TIM)